MLDELPPRLLAWFMMNYLRPHDIKNLYITSKRFHKLNNTQLKLIQRASNTNLWAAVSKDDLELVKYYDLIYKLSIFTQNCYNPKNKILVMAINDQSLKCVNFIFRTFQMELDIEYIDDLLNLCINNMIIQATQNDSVQIPNKYICLFRVVVDYVFKHNIAITSEMVDLYIGNLQTLRLIDDSIEPCNTYVCGCENQDCLVSVACDLILDFSL